MEPKTSYTIQCNQSATVLQLLQQDNDVKEVLFKYYKSVGGNFIMGINKINQTPTYTWHITVDGTSATADTQVQQNQTVLIKYQSYKPEGSPQWEQFFS